MYKQSLFKKLLDVIFGEHTCNIIKFLYFIDEKKKFSTKFLHSDKYYLNTQTILST